MLITCWSAKGGCGTTTVAAALALSLSEETQHDVVLVDLGGDLPAALGLPEPVGTGVSDALAAHPAHHPAERALRARTAVVDGLALVPRGIGPLRAGPPMEALLAGLASGPSTVVVDAGVVHPHTAAFDAVAASSLSLLVLRRCYLALRRAVALPLRPSAIVLVDEPGRSLGKADVEAVLGVPVRAVVPHDPSIARSLDAGLLLARMPRSLSRAVRDAA